jgi:hypothetical protein
LAAAAWVAVLPAEGLCLGWYWSQHFCGWLAALVELAGWLVWEHDLPTQEHFSRTLPLTTPETNHGSINIWAACLGCMFGLCATISQPAS